MRTKSPDQIQRGRLSPRDPSLLSKDVVPRFTTDLKVLPPCHPDLESALGFFTAKSV